MTLLIGSGGESSDSPRCLFGTTEKYTWCMFLIIGLALNSDIYVIVMVYLD